MSANQHDLALERLRQLIDISQPAEVCNYMYFQTQRNAMKAKTQVDMLGMTCEVRESPTSGEWGLYATLGTVLDRDVIEKICNELTKIAEQFGGEYDGWEVAVANPDDPSAEKRVQ